MNRQKKRYALLLVAMVAMMVLPMLKLSAMAGGSMYSETVYVEYGKGITIGPDLSDLSMPSGYTADTLTVKWYEWDENYHQISDATGLKYTIDSVTERHLYGAEVYAGDELIYSIDYDVCVQNHFEVSVSGSYDVKASYGQTQTFSVSATADKGEIKYAWTNGDGSVVCEEPTYEFTVTKSESFRCIVTDMYGTMIDRWFSVSIDNKLTASPVGELEHTVKYGDSLTLQVEASCLVGDLTYYWSMGNSNTDTCVISSVQYSTSCTCYVEDEFGNSVLVEFKIKVENGLSAAAADGVTNVAVKVGADTKLVVDASCNSGDLTYDWYLYVNEYNMTNKNVNSNTLALTGVNRTAKYLCRVTDAYYNVAEVLFTVTVENGLKATAVNDPDVYVNIGEKAVLEVEASCDNGEVKYMWSHNSKPVGASYDDGASYTLTNILVDTKFYCHVCDEYGTVITVEFNIVVNAEELNSDYVYVITWNDELENVLQYVYSQHSQLGSKVKVISAGVGGTDEQYFSMIESLIKNNPNITFIIAADMAAVPRMSKLCEFVDMDTLGIAEKYTQSYPYTRKIGTVDGKLVGVTWQATPGIFEYDPDIAMEVLGTSDPDKIQEMIGTVEGYLSVAAKMKAKGYYMTSGAANYWRGDNVEYYSGMLANMADIAYGSDGTMEYGLTDAQKADAKKLIKEIKSNGYDTGNGMWTSEWYDDMKTGKVFGWFSCSWGTSFIFTLDKPKAVCQGPIPYFWGGTYLYVKSGNNDSVAADVLTELCCDEDIMTYTSYACGSFPNNAQASYNMISTYSGSDVYKDNQNVYVQLDKMARAIDGGSYTLEYSIVPPNSNGIVSGMDGVYYYVIDGEIQSSHTGFVTVDGVSYYVKSGVWQNKTSGFVTSGTKQYYIANGIRSTKTGFVTVGTKKYYIKSGVRSTGTGLVTVGTKQYYIVNGIFQSTKTGIIVYGTKQYYIKSGVRSTATGLATIGTKQYYVVTGVFQSTKTGFVTVGTRKYYVKSGIRSSATGLVTVGTKQYYIVTGVLQSTKTGFITYGSKKYYVKSGVRSTATGLVTVGTKKYYIANGIFQSAKTGIVKSGTKYYYVVKGVFQSTKTGFVKNAKGQSCYIKKGVWMNTYTGKVTISGHAYSIVKGIMTKKLS